MSAPDESGDDRDRVQADDAVETMHKATEYLRNLWVRMNTDATPAEEFEDTQQPKPVDEQ